MVWPLPQCGHSFLPSGQSLVSTASIPACQSGNRSKNAKVLVAASPTASLLVVLAFLHYDNILIHQRSAVSSTSFSTFLRGRGEEDLL